MSTQTETLTQEEMLKVMQTMAATMETMNSQMQTMQEKVDNINKISKKSAQSQKAMDRFMPTILWSMDKIEQLSKFKHPMMGWTPFGRVNMNTIEDTKTKGDDKDRKPGEGVVITEADENSTADEDTENEEDINESEDEPAEFEFEKDVMEEIKL